VTKSLSNLIKYYNFNVTEDKKRVVESDSRVGNFIPGLLTHGEVEVRDKEREEFDEEFPEEMFAEQEEQEQGNAIKNEEILDAAHEQAGKILEQAKKDAEKLVEQAKITAELEKEKILEESKKAGYKDGLVQANDEVASQKEELEQRAQQLEEEYQQLVEQLEPDFVKLVINLVKKLTGVLVEDKKDIILYLMEQSLKNLGKTMKLVIRVSADDVEMVRNEQERLLEFVDKDCEMEIVLDSTLKKNQCLLEADKQIIDCSLDVQMQSLIENLKMMM